jgi:uncharacterized membrane protein YkvA (DUF1232 family)
MPSYVKLMYRLFKDKAVPDNAKRNLTLALGYNISPIDLIPGFIPVIGQIDNVYITIVLLKRAILSCPPEIARKHLIDADVCMDEIDQDIATARELMKEVGKIVLKTTGKVLQLSAKGLYRLGKLAVNAAYKSSR